VSAKWINVNVPLKRSLFNIKCSAFCVQLHANGRMCSYAYICMMHSKTTLIRKTLTVWIALIKPVIMKHLRDRDSSLSLSLSKTVSRWRAVWEREGGEWQEDIAGEETMSWAEDKTGRRRRNWVWKHLMTLRILLIVRYWLFLLTVHCSYLYAVWCFSLAAFF